MLLAALREVDKFYGGQTVLDGVTLELRSESRTALIGRNGAGKTTILRLLAGVEESDGGTVFARDDTLVGRLEQDPALAPEATLEELAAGAFAELARLERRLSEIETAGLDDPARYGVWEGLHARFERRGGYERRSRRDAVFHALGFQGREQEPVARLSGGEQTRLGLACLLMRQPDLLLLDEPTNHLDMEMRGWLEGHLARYPGAALIVSHDRTFLDRACDRTAEIARGVLRVADGNPTAYREAQLEQRRIEGATRANQEREQARLSAAAEQMKRWARQNAKLHRRAKAMERRLGRYEAAMIDAPEGDERKTRFRFPSGPSGAFVVQAEHLSKGFPEPLFADVNLTVRQGERIALVGPNGAGKTTFLRVLLGELPSDDPRGQVRFGARVRVGYYDQGLSEVDPAATLTEELIRLVGDVEAHNLLGRFLFPYEAQYKRVADLSGGERARLALLKLTLREANFLVLDEPTNHLDLEMIEALEAALLDFEGTLLLVSHDRRFIERVSTTIWEVRGGAFTAFEGDWAFYQRKCSARAAPSPRPGRVRPGPVTRTRTGPSRWKLERDLEALEQRITGLEVRLGELNRTLAQPDLLGPDQIVELGREYTGVEEALLEAMAHWETTTTALGEAGC